MQEYTPSYKLKRLAGYDMNVYAPSFFKIKTDHYVFKGTNNFWFAMQKANNFLTEEEKVLSGQF